LVDVPITPQPPSTSTVATGGTPVIAVLAVPVGINGGYVVNPLTAADQGLGAVEPLYVNIVTNATTSGNGTTIALQAGQSFTLVPGQTTAVSVNAATSGHKFTTVWW
jgi:hypothetical protein